MVVDDVLDLPRPVYNNTLQLLNQILRTSGVTRSDFSDTERNSRGTSVSLA